MIYIVPSTSYIKMSHWLEYFEAAKTARKRVWQLVRKCENKYRYNKMILRVPDMRNIKMIHAAK